MYDDPISLAFTSSQMTIKLRDYPRFSVTYVAHNGIGLYVKDASKEYRFYPWASIEYVLLESDEVLS